MAMRPFLLLPLLFTAVGCSSCSGGHAQLECSAVTGTLTLQDITRCTDAPHDVLSLRIAPPPLDSLSAGALVNFTMLRCLQLQSLNLTALPPASFASLIALEVLDLSANRLHALPSTLFVSLADLEVLDLSANALTELPTDLLKHQIALRSLNLSANRLTSLPERLFASLVQLLRLDLSANQLTTLSSQEPPHWPIGFELRTAANPLPLCWSFNGTHLSTPDPAWWWCFHYERIVSGRYSEPKLTLTADNASSSSSNASGSADSLLVWYSPQGFLYSFANGTTWRHQFDLTFVSSVRVLSPDGGDLQISRFRSYFSGVWTLLRVHSRGHVRVLMQVMLLCSSPLKQVYIWSLIVSGVSMVAMMLAGLLTALIRLIINTRCFTRKILMVSTLSLEELQYSPRTQRKRLLILRKYEASRAALLCQEQRNNPGADGDSSTGSSSLLASIDETSPESPPLWLPPHRLATYDLFSHGGASETEPDSDMDAVDDDDAVDDSEVGSWWRMEELGERFRAGMSRHVDHVRTRMREGRHNVEESTSRMMRQLRSGSQVAALKMRSGLATSVDVVKWKVRNITELCGGGVANLGQTVSVSTLVTDMDTQTTTQRHIVDVTAV